MCARPEQPNGIAVFALLAISPVPGTSCNVNEQFFSLGRRDATLKAANSGM